MALESVERTENGYLVNTSDWTEEIAAELFAEEGIDPTMPTGSYAGAMGMPQFMPDSFRVYAIDFEQRIPLFYHNNTALNYMIWYGGGAPTLGPPGPRSQPGPARGPAPARPSSPPAGPPREPLERFGPVA